MLLLQKLFSSQKFIVLLVSVIGLLITKIFKIVVDPATITEFVILIGGYLIGQGIADNGKEAAKINAVAASSLSDQNTPKATAAIEQMASELNTPPQ